MNYAIYFDESNKLDQPNSGYSYYGALGARAYTIEHLVNNIKQQNEKIKTRSEMHFVNYTSDTDFEKYFKNLNVALMQDVNINLMIVNNEDAKRIAEKMNASMSELRELFYHFLTEDSHFKEYKGRSPMSKWEMNVSRR
ncbi:hypothetical protein D5F11_004120 [Siminovitchia terrae]|uniref:DUF3800 domain-containing protein n=2 Tax=Siminovitchia terrae TaxID=1914933 RepID=A0A429XCP0_SIMTE|nr:hypothetical protein [Siminovitchia terrae]RST61237.1 hypothetical protein D5F11_004120 [Siminovitchia terrae]